MTPKQMLAAQAVAFVSGCGMIVASLVYVDRRIEKNVSHLKDRWEAKVAALQTKTSSNLSLFLKTASLSISLKDPVHIRPHFVFHFPEEPFKFSISLKEPMHMGPHFVFLS